MLFTTASFVFLFLPVVFAVYLLLLHFTVGRAAIPWLGIASIVFYIWGDVRLIALLMSSIAVNFWIGGRIFATGGKGWLRAGVLFNVGLLGLFKYADFAISTANALTGSHLGLLGIALPLGISFYTFQQIAWLVDMRSKPQKPRFWDYLLFVTFFPQLIAGPIVHHSEMMPQFQRIVGAGKSLYFSRLWTHLAVGLTIFIVGLFKKVVIADSCAPIATQMFSQASTAQAIDVVSAWGGVIAYSMQIYFDFSGYSDMAVGLARMFGVRLPVNFFSPYKATSIIEFWRRWHMTLSRWLRDYIYIPLGGNRDGAARRQVNLMATMIVGGLWHGASWTFVAWGGVHGLFLLANHGWNGVRGNLTLGPFAWPLTFLAVIHAWVLFRAPDFAAAMNIYAAMYSGKIRIPAADYRMVAAAVLIAAFWPNTYEVLRRYHPVIKMQTTALRGFSMARFLKGRVTVKPWRPTTAWALAIAGLAVVYAFVISRSDAYVEFIYFQF